MRLIDASQIHYCWMVGIDGEDHDGVTLQSVINKMPTIDAEPVKHGHWELLDECSNAGVYCSVCHKKVYKIDYANQKIKSNYCPNCGARMDEEK